MPEFILVQTSLDSRDNAYKLAEFVVGQRLAAGCWLSGPISSIYWWKGNLKLAQEWVCSFRTRKELYSDLERTIRENHPYEVPEIVATPIVAGSASFLNWIVTETAEAAETDGAGEQEI